MPDAPQTTTRQKILDTAGELFFRQGYRAVGVDTIVRESGIAKMTLYRHFPSKDDLIAAHLEQVNQLTQAWMDEAVQSHPSRPREQLLAIFAALQELVKNPRCCGCAFQVASAEFPELDNLAHKAALAHKQSVLERFYKLAGEAGAGSPQTLAAQLLLLMDGAFSAARMFGSDNPGQNVAAAAALLIDAQINAANAWP